jgi:hypothetical protein
MGRKAIVIILHCLEQAAQITDTGLMQISNRISELFPTDYEVNQSTVINPSAEQRELLALQLDRK